MRWTDAYFEWVPSSRIESCVTFPKSKVFEKNIESKFHEMPLDKLSPWCGCKRLTISRKAFLRLTMLVSKCSKSMSAIWYLCWIIHTRSQQPAAAAVNRAQNRPMDYERWPGRIHLYGNCAMFFKQKFLEANVMCGRCDRWNNDSIKQCCARRKRHKEEARRAVQVIPKSNGQNEHICVGDNVYEQMSCFPVEWRCLAEDQLWIPNRGLRMKRNIVMWDDNKNLT